jgi:hypothetical protein
MTTWNPSDLSGVTLSGGNLTATANVGAWGSGARATAAVSGKRYWRVKCTAVGGGYTGAALCTASEPLNALMGGTDGWVFFAQVGATGAVWHLSGTIGAFPTFVSNGDWVVIAVDAGANLLFVTTMTAAGALDTNWNGTSANPSTGTGGFSTSSASGALYPAANFNETNDVAVLDPTTVISAATLSGFQPLDPAPPPPSGTLYIAEYDKLQVDSNGKAVMAPREPSLAEQTITIGMSSTKATNAFGTRTKFVQLSTDAICSVAFGASPSASAANQRLPANTIVFKGVNPGDSVAVITNS